MLYSPSYVLDNFFYSNHREAAQQIKTPLSIIMFFLNRLNIIMDQLQAPQKFCVITTYIEVTFLQIYIYMYICLFRLFFKITDQIYNLTHV